MTMRAWNLFRNAKLPSVILLNENTSKFQFSTRARFFCNKVAAIVIVIALRNTGNMTVCKVYYGIPPSLLLAVASQH